MTIVIKTEEYLKLKLAGIPLPREILKALAVSLKEGLTETISCPDELCRYNKELPTDVFEDAGSLEIKSRNVPRKNYVGYESYVDLTNLEGFRRSDRIIWI